MSVGIIPLLVLVLVAIVAIPILIRVFGSAAVGRNPNRAESEEDRARQERESGEQNRRGR